MGVYPRVECIVLLLYLLYLTLLHPFLESVSLLKIPLPLNRDPSPQSKVKWRLHEMSRAHPLQLPPHRHRIRDSPTAAAATERKKRASQGEETQGADDEARAHETTPPRAQSPPNATVHNLTVTV